MNDLTAKTRAWLERQGYPFELQVGRDLTASGWNTQHARFFTDSRTGKTRELDIVATKFGQLHPREPAVSVALAVECKRSLDKPWVVFSSDRREADLVLPGYLVPGGLAGLALLAYSPLTHPRPILMIGKGHRRGHGIVRVSFSKDSPRAPNAAYSAVRGVVAAAQSFAVASERLALEFKQPFVQIVFPVVILDGVLFEMTLDASGQENLNQVSSSKVYCPRAGVAGQDVCTVTVATRDGLAEVIADADADLQAFNEHLRPQIPMILDLYREQVRSQQL